MSWATGYRIQEQLHGLYGEIKRLKDELKSKDKRIKEQEGEIETLKAELKKSELETKTLRNVYGHATTLAIECALEGLGE